MLKQRKEIHYLRTMRHPLRWIAFWAFVLSLFLPVFHGSDLKGYHVVLFGAVGLIHFSIFLGLPWLANLGFLLAFRMQGSLRRAWVIMVSLVMASFAWGIDKLPQDLAENPDGVTADWGLRIWYLAFVLLALDALLGRYAGVRISRRKKSSTTKEDADQPASIQHEEPQSALL